MDFFGGWGGGGGGFLLESFTDVMPCIAVFKALQQFLPKTLPSELWIRGVHVFDDN